MVLLPLILICLLGPDPLPACKYACRPRLKSCVLRKAEEEQMQTETVERERERERERVGGWMGVKELVGKRKEGRKGGRPNKAWGEGGVH